MNAYSQLLEALEQEARVHASMESLPPHALRSNFARQGGSSSSDKRLPRGLAVYVARVKDYSCLVPPPPAFFNRPAPVVYSGPPDAAAMLEFVNQHCGTHRALHGDLDATGAAIHNLEAAAWRAEPKETVEWARANGWRVGEGGNDHGACERVPASSLTALEFMREYVAKSKPVVLAGATQEGAFKHWTNDYLRQLVGDSRVHVKVSRHSLWNSEHCLTHAPPAWSQVSDSSDFEGPEDARRWKGGSAALPDFVQEQLQSPELVLVRPATQDVPFAQFMDSLYAPRCDDPMCANAPPCPGTGNASHSDVAATCTAAADGTVGTCSGDGVDVHPCCRCRTATFYIEYLSMVSYLAELYEDAGSLPVSELLQGETRNFWFGDGKTVGKLHFDPFENLLFMVAGQFGWVVSIVACRSH